MTLDVTGGRPILTFNGGLAVGGSDLIINLKETGEIRSDQCQLRREHAASWLPRP